MIRCEELATRLISGRVDWTLFTNLQEFKLEKQINNHGKVYLKGIVPDRQTADECLELLDSAARIEVSGKQTVLFAGLVTRVELLAASQYFELTVEAVSCSYELDIQKKYRSFQNINLTYEALIRKVLTDHPGAGFSIDTALKNTLVGRIYLQYDETDFEFLQRIASQCQAVLIPDAAAAKPWFHFGVPIGNDGGNLQTACFGLKSDLAHYRYVTGNQLDLSGNEADFILYQAEGRNQFLDLGQKVELNGEKLLVYQATVAKAKSELKQECLLATAAGFKPDPLYNERLAGVVLRGKVIARENDRVQVHLAIDEQQQPDQAFWFSYASFYTAAGHTGLYVMPELGDTVNLYCPGREEPEAFIINSLREPGKLQDVDIDTKCLRTSFGKDLIFDEHTITIIGKEGARGQAPLVYIQIDDRGEIKIASDSQIILDAANDLTVTSGGAITISATAGQEFACGQCDLILNGRTEFNAPKLINGVVPEEAPEETETEEAAAVAEEEQERQAVEEVWYETNDADIEDDSEEITVTEEDDAEY